MSSKESALSLCKTERLVFRKRLIGQQEIGVFRKIAVDHFGFDKGMYRPEDYEASPRAGFVAAFDRKLKFGSVPTADQVRALMDKIHAACCIKKEKQ